MTDYAAHIQTVPVSKRGKFWLYIFLVAVFLLLVSLSTLIWPRVRVVVKPEFELVKIGVPIKIDLDLKEPNFNVGVIPGQLVTSSSQEFEVARSGWRFYNLDDDKKLLVDDVFVNKLINNSLYQKIGEHRIMRPGTFNVTWQNPIKNRSERSFTVNAAVQAQFYPQFPLLDWENRLVGKQLSDIEEWIKHQPGVALVSVSLYPSFFAKISQKAPSNPSAITIILDIN
jgi:hypothetical protein